MNYKLLRRALFRLAKGWGDEEPESPKGRSPIVQSYSRVVGTGPFSSHPTIPVGHVRYHSETIDPNKFEGSVPHRTDHGEMDAGEHPDAPERWGGKNLDGERPPDVGITHVQGHSVFTNANTNIYDAHTEMHVRAHLNRHPEHADNRVHIGVTPTPFRLSELTDTEKMVGNRWPSGSIPLFMHTKPGEGTEHPSLHEFDQDNEVVTEHPHLVGLHSQPQMDAGNVQRVHGDRGKLDDGFGRKVPFTAMSTRQWISNTGKANPEEHQRHVANIPLQHLVNAENDPDDAHNYADPHQPLSRRHLSGVMYGLRWGANAVKTPINPTLVHNVSQAEASHADDYLHTMVPDQSRADGESSITAKVAGTQGNGWHLSAYVARLHQYADQAHDLPRHEPKLED